MERSAIVSVVLMFALLLAAGPVFAQHFVLDPTNGDTHTLFVASATIAGDDLIENDEIGVFTTAGTVRGLAVVEENGAIPEITVFGQGDEDGGFTDGEIMAFKIWDASAEEEMTAFVSGGAIITFTANDADAISLEVLDQHFQYQTTDAEHFLIVSLADIDGTSIAIGDEIGVFTPDNVCAGGYVITELDGGDLFPAGFSAYGGPTGFSVGEALSFRLYDSSEDTEHNANADWASFDAQTFLPDRVSPISRLFAYTNPIPAIRFSNASLDFGDVYLLDGESSSINLTILNNGFDDLTVNSISSNNNAFTFDFDDNAFVLAPGARRVFNITFVPPEAGNIEGVLTIDSDDPNDEEVTINMEGVGVVAEPATLELESDSNDFGSLNVGSESTWNMHITNTGYYNLIVNSIVSNEDAYETNFGGEPQVIAGGASLDVTVTFAPTLRGQQPATLTITSNHGGNLGVETVVNVTGYGNAPDIALDSAAVRFGGVIIDEEGTAVVTITNVGELNLTIQDVTIPGDIFSSDWAGQLVLAQNAEVEVTLTFAPTAEQDYQETMTITSNDPGNGSLEIPLTGTGDPYPPADLSIAVGDQNHNFGETTVNSDAEWVFPITNNGYLDLVISNITSDENTFTTDFPGGDGWTIARGQSQNVTVTFAPTEVGDRNGTLTITSNDQGQDGSTDEVTVAGTGVAEQLPQISTNPNNVAFPDKIIGESTTEIVTISNIGQLELTVSNVAIVNDAGGVFGVLYEGNAWDGNVVIQPAASIQVSVSFSPDAVQDFTGDLRITSDDRDDGTIDVELTGTGLVQPPPDIFVAQGDLSHNYGNVLFGTQTTWQFDITNNGYLDLVVDSILTSLGVYTTNLSEDGVTLAGGESTTITATFAPVAGVEYNGTLTIYSNDDNDNESPIRITVTGVGLAPRITVAPENVAFGDVVAGNSETSSIRISNPGSSALTVTEIQFNNNVFSGDLGGQQVIAVGQFIDLELTFTPTDIDDFEGILTVISDAENDQSLDIPLTGAGVSAFQFTQTGESTTLIINSGLINNEAMIEGDEVGVFTPDGVCAGGSVLGANGFDSPIGFSAWGDDLGTQDVVEGFTRNEAFAFRLWDRSTGTEYVAYENWSPEVVPVWTANGGPYVILELLGYDDPPPITRLSDSNLNFGDVYLFDGESSARDLTIRNIGGANLTIQSVVSDNDAFSLDFPNQIILQPDASTTVTITFVPPELGDISGVVTVTSNDPRNGEMTVNMAGVGVEAPAPDIGVNEESHAFGTIEVGSPLTWTLVVTNNGYEALVIDDVQSGNAAYTTDFAGDQVTLARLETMDVVVTFDPATAGDFNTNLTITSNNGGNANSEYNVALSGAAIAPDIAVTPSPVVFDDTIFGEEDTATLTISNDGAVDLVISSITIPDGVFSSDWADQQTVVPGEEYVLNLTFAPIAAQDYEVVATIASNDPVDGNLNVTLQGTGLPQPAPNLVIADEDLTHNFGEVFVGNGRTWQ
ncbi:MAG: choice-of-anchor D domain-containing protein, partial [Calditrichaeota bacterium]|nr:choice-of-anchor D domain-containing protein [Calditrichota bacterium]